MGIKSGRSCKLTVNILERKIQNNFCGKHLKYSYFNLTIIETHRCKN